MTKPVIEPKSCACQCGEQTKGGAFRMGHDARWVSQQVAKAMETGEPAPIRTEIEAVSAKLAVKFDKSLERAKLKAAQVKHNPPRKPRVKRAEGEDADAANRARAKDRVDNLMNRINHSYWAGMTGTVEDLPAKVQRELDGKLEVMVTLPTVPPRVELRVVHKEAFTKAKRHTVGDDE